MSRPHPRTPRSRTPRPRTLAVLAACLVLLAAGGLVAVRLTAWHGSVTVLATWTGSDEQHFRQEVIEPFEHEEHIHVLYQGSSAESQVLAADVEAGTAPDVAVLPGPGELAGYARQGRLADLDHVVDTGEFAAPWAARSRGPDGRQGTYWVPIKTDLKSLVWHPATMSDDQVAAAAARPQSWCLGMADGATSGWPGTDWIEDILLQQAGPGTYQQWAIGNLDWRAPAVRRAFSTWGAMVGAGDRALTSMAMVTDFGDAAKGLLPGAVRPCVLEHQGAFVRAEEPWRVIGTHETPSRRVIPGARTGSDDWEVSGDLAAVFHMSSQARALITYLTRTDVQQRWSRAQGGFSADRDVSPAAIGIDPVDSTVVQALRDRGVDRCYDASDAMPPAMRDAFALAALHYLADPGSLDAQLAVLEKVREGLRDDSTAGGTSQVWLPAVCGSS